ncbi:MAG: sodium:solute symporter, partial [Halieaceae bacterium]|nr:sodium:solute symporter [Halieaceae bacterium]
TAYGVASILALVMNVDYLTAIVLLMGVTIAYDVLGGMRAVVVSDVVQMVLLIAAVLIALGDLAPSLAAQHVALAERTAPLLDDWGVTGSSDYGFWPMLFGGLFLYVAYYGFDQSQAQRLLSAGDDRALRRILLLNGLLRFPLVLAYCVLGLGLAAYALEHPGFLSALPMTEQGDPNINLVFPYYVLEAFPAGLAGLAIVGLFAAAMSSLDSALNSLSASTLEDFLPTWAGRHSERDNFLLSKLLTLAWGGFAVAFSFFVEQIAGTVLEAINKVGSLVFGPMLGLFLVALLMPAAGERRALAGFVAGVAVNGYAWTMLPQLSWLWWNVLGCAVVLLFALTALPRLARPVFAGLAGVRTVARALVAGALAMLAILLILQSGSGVATG